METEQQLERVNRRLDNLDVLLRVGLLTPKEHRKRRELVIEAAIDGPALRRGRVEREESDPNKRPHKKVRLTGFEYYDPSAQSFAIADTQQVEALEFAEDGSDDSTYNEDSLSISLTSGSSSSTSSTSSSGGDTSGSGELSEDEPSHPSPPLEARDPRRLFDFSGRQ